MTVSIKGKRSKILAIGTIFLTVFAVTLMVLNLYKESLMEELPLREFGTKNIPQMFSQQRYEKTINALTERYYSSVSHVRNVFAKPKDEKTEEDKWGKEKQINFTEKTSLEERLRIVKIYKKPVELLFKGYLQLGDGAYIGTINWAGKTNFKKVGDEIRGYKMTAFEKDVKEKTTLWGGTEKIDLSTIMLERSNGEKLELQIGKMTLEKEIFAQIDDLQEKMSYDVHIGSAILGYKILDISPAKVIIEDSQGQKVELERHN